MAGRARIPVASVNQAVNPLGKIFLTNSNFMAAVRQYIVVSVLACRLDFLCFLCVVHVYSSHIVICFGMCWSLFLAGCCLVFTLTVHYSGWPLHLNQLLKVDIFVLLFKTQVCIQKSLMSLAK